VGGFFMVTVPDRAPGKRYRDVLATSGGFSFPESGIGNAVMPVSVIAGPATVSQVYKSANFPIALFLIKDGE
jgi:hypothetical protein